MLHVVLHVVVVVVVGVPVARLLRKATLGQPHVLSLKEDRVLALELTNTIGTLEHLMMDVLRWYSDGNRMVIGWQSDGNQPRCARDSRAPDEGCTQMVLRW